MLLINILIAYSVQVFMASMGTVGSGWNSDNAVSIQMCHRRVVSQEIDH